MSFQIDLFSLPPSLAILLLNPSLISPTTRPLSSQPFAQRGRSVLLRHPVRAPQSVNPPSNSVPLVVSSQQLVPLSSTPIELPPVVNLLEPEEASISKDSITLDVQSLRSSSVQFFARIVIANDLRNPPDLHDWKWPPGWESRLSEPYQLGTAAPPMIAAPTGRRRYWDLDGNEIIVSVIF